MQKYNLKDVKYMRYLDYKLNNTPKYIERYAGIRFPRLVEFIVSHEGDDGAISATQALHDAKKIYKILWTEGLFHSCQA